MTREHEEAQALADELKRDYPFTRVLPDNSVACVCPLITTTSLILGCTRAGWAKRFCFESSTLALRRFAELQSEDDEPAGYIARR